MMIRRFCFLEVPQDWDMEDPPVGLCWCEPETDLKLLPMFLYTNSREERKAQKALRAFKERQARKAIQAHRENADVMEAQAHKAGQARKVRRD